MISALGDNSELDELKMQISSMERSFAEELQELWERMEKEIDDWKTKYETEAKRAIELSWDVEFQSKEASYIRRENKLRMQNLEADYT